MHTQTPRKQELVWAPGWDFSCFSDSEEYGVLYLFLPKEVDVPREWLVYDRATGQIVAITESLAEAGELFLLTLSVNTLAFQDMLRMHDFGARIAA